MNKIRQYKQYLKRETYLYPISNLHNGFLRHSDIAGKAFRAKRSVHMPLDVTTDDASQGGLM